VRNPRSAIVALSRTEMVALRLSVPSSRQIRDPGAGQTGQNGQLPSPSGCGYTVRGVIVEPSRSGLSRDFDHIWWWRTRLPERKGQRCRILVRAKRMNSVLVEFEDGFRVVTSRYAVRRTRPDSTAGAAEEPRGP